MPFPRFLIVLALLAALPLAAADRLIVFHADSQEASVFAAPSLRSLGSAPAPQGAFAAFRAGDKTFLVGSAQVRVLDADLRATASIELPDDPATAATFDALGQQLLVAAGGRLYRIDTLSARIDSTLDVTSETGGEATALYLPPDGRRLYWLRAGSRQARVVDLATNLVLPGTVDLAASPDVFSSGLLGSGAQVFPAGLFSGGVAGVFAPSQTAPALLAANAAGAKLLRSTESLLYVPADASQPVPLADPTTGDALAPTSQPVAIGDDGTAYLALEDGRLLAVDPSGVSSASTAWTLSAATGLALAPEPGPEQNQITLEKISGDGQFVISGNTFTIVVKGPTGGVPMTVVSNSAAAQCDNVPALSGTTPIDCTANTVSAVTSVTLTVSSLGLTADFTVYVVPPDLGDGLFIISGDGQTVSAGGSLTLVVEKRSNGLPLPGASLTVVDDSASLTCPAIGVSTNEVGRKSITCTVAASVPASHIATISVSDTATPPNSVQFTATIVGQSGGNDAIVRITPDPVTVFENTSFNLTVETRAGGVAQPSVALSIVVNNSVVQCPASAVTGQNGQATIACGAGEVPGDLNVQVTISDGTRSLAYSVTVKDGVLVEGIRKVSGDNQIVAPSTSFGQPLVVRAVSAGQVQPNLVLFVTVNSSAVTCSTNTLTDEFGLASIACTAGEVTGPTPVTIQVADAFGRSLPAPFNATITPNGTGTQAERIQILSGGVLAARVGDSFPAAIQVRTETDAGAIVAGATVFIRGPQGITFTPASIPTNAAGIATFDVAFGCAPPSGTIELGLTAGGTDATVSYSLTRGPFAQLRKVQGDGQVGVPNQPLPLALVVESTDQCGTLTINAPVSWAVVPPEAATLEGVVSITNGQGRASARVRPTARGGTYEVRAVSPQDANILASFSLSTTSTPAQLVIVSGNQQSVSLNSAAPAPLVIRVATSGGQPVQGVQVGFSIISGSGSLGQNSGVTDAQGQASTTFTAGPTRGPVTVRAVAVGFSVDFGLTVGGGTPQLQVPGFVNGASFRSGFVAGGTGSIFGVNITDGQAGVFPAPYDPLNGFPTLFRGVRVTIGGIAAPILSLANVNGQEQINIQVPFGLAGPTVTAVVENQGSLATISGIPLSAAQPGVFEYALNNQLYAAVLHADYSVVTPSNPARPGEILLLFATALGAVSPPVPTNQAGPSSPLSSPVALPAVTLGGVEQVIEGAFYAPQLISVYQINFRVGANVQPGTLDLVITSQGVASQTAKLPVGAAF